MTRLGAAGLASLTLLVACHGAPTARAAADAAPVYADTAVQSAVKFTQDFYDWYRQRDIPTDIAVKERPALFEQSLLSALRADFTAQAKDSEYIVGIDWDPFTGNQDPCVRYTVAGATWSGDTVNVPVRGICGNAAPHTGPDVIAQLRRTTTGWVFVDFRHADNKGSLREDLAQLKRERDSTPAKGAAR